MKKIYLILSVINAAGLLWFAIPNRPLETIQQSLQPKVKSVVQVDDRADRIDAYFEKYKMPLKGYGQKFIEEADKNGIDWRLMPAISVKESSGGKAMCKNNPFGWGSCKITFQNIDEAIETLAKNLGGNNPKTHRYYSGDTRSKLYYYNGTVEPLYPDRVMKIMESF